MQHIVLGCNPGEVFLFHASRRIRILHITIRQSVQEKEIGTVENAPVLVLHDDIALPQTKNLGVVEQ